MKTTATPLLTSPCKPINCSGQEPKHANYICKLQNNGTSWHSLLSIAELMVRGTSSSFCVICFYGYNTEKVKMD